MVVVGRVGSTVGIAGGRSGGVRPSTDMADGSMGGLGSLKGFDPNLPAKPPPLDLVFAT